MTDAELIITPDTKVGKILEEYPQVEDLLIAMSPSFKKLRNPVLRKTVAKVATLYQVAKVGNIPVGKLVNDLRQAVGQEAASFVDDADKSASEIPEWYDENMIVDTIDARPIIEAGEHPFNAVFSSLQKLENNKILALITPFNPAPLIEKVVNKGFDCFSKEIDENSIYTYFVKK